MISFFVAPFRPDNWESAVSDLRIAPESYCKQMRQQWPHANIYSPPPDSTYALRWELNEEEQLGAAGGLQKDQQVVEISPYPQTSFLGFVLWHRAAVSNKYRLFLFSSSSLDYLELTFQTTAEDVKQFCWRHSE